MSPTARKILIRVEGIQALRKVQGSNKRYNRRSGRKKKRQKKEQKRNKKGTQKIQSTPFGAK